MRPYTRFSRNKRLVLRGKQRFSIGYGQCFHHTIYIARDKRFEIILTKPNPMIGYATLREIVSAYPFAPIPRAYHTSTICFSFPVILPVIKIVHARAKHLKRPFFVFEL